MRWEQSDGKWSVPPLDSCNLRIWYWMLPGRNVSFYPWRDRQCTLWNPIQESNLRLHVRQLQLRPLEEWQKEDNQCCQYILGDSEQIVCRSSMCDFSHLCLLAHDRKWLKISKSVRTICVVKFTCDHTPGKFSFFSEIVN